MKRMKLRRAEGKETADKREKRIRLQKKMKIESVYG